MNEIIKKTIDLLKVLDKSNLIKDITFYKKEIVKNEDIMKLIELGNNADDIEKLKEIKIKLYQNNSYKKYMDSYNELSYLVLKINKKYSNILDERSCHK